MTTFSVQVSMYSGLVSTVSGKHLSIYSGLTAKMCLLISGKDNYNYSYYRLQFCFFKNGLVGVKK